MLKFCYPLHLEIRCPYLIRRTNTLVPRAKAVPPMEIRHVTNANESGNAARWHGYVARDGLGNNTKCEPNEGDESSSGNDDFFRDSNDVRGQRFLAVR